MNKTLRLEYPRIAFMALGLSFITQAAAAPAAKTPASPDCSAAEYPAIGALVLEGEVHLKDGKSVMQRISWKAQDEGVREWAVLSKDGGKTWTPAFDVLFLKHEDNHD